MKQFSNISGFHSINKQQKSTSTKVYHTLGNSVQHQQIFSVIDKLRTEGISNVLFPKCFT